MKVVIISNSTRGGAGLAALRLHKALGMSDIDSSILGIDVDESIPGVVKYNRSIVSKLMSHNPFSVKRRMINKMLDSYNATATFQDANFDISVHPLIKEADIVNLHWVGNMINYKTFFDRVKKPIVWTLHDMNPFSGFSHFRTDIIRHQNLQHVDQKRLEDKAKYITKAHNLTVVTLCNWMKKISEKSKAFHSKRHIVIPNSLNIEIFKPYNKHSVREIFGLPLDKKILLFCCQNIDDPRKGYDLLVDAISHIDKDCVYAVIGKSNMARLDSEKIRYLGQFTDEITLALIYSAADVFVLPSREDNLPNTMVESLCCGTPVISFTNGGMVDVIKDDFNGCLSKDMTSDSLAKTINTVLLNIDNFDRKEISRIARDMFSPAIQSQSYIRLFESLINNTQK